MSPACKETCSNLGDLDRLFAQIKREKASSNLCSAMPVLRGLPLLERSPRIFMTRSST